MGRERLRQAPLAPGTPARQIGRVLLQEPIPTAIVLALFGLMLLVSVLSSRATERLGVPVALIFLAVGMLAGSEGFLRIPFEDYRLAYRLGTIALVLILFDGGFNTPLSLVKRVAAPAAVLATFGVVGTAALLAAGAWLLGFSGPEALLVGVVASSTDAAGAARKWSAPIACCARRSPTSTTASTRKANTTSLR